MTRRRWTDADDRAVAEAAEDHAVAEAMLPAIAAVLGIDPDELEVTAVRRVGRPCAHWRCRARRAWARIRPGRRS